jgi:hypothetical protein
MSHPVAEWDRRYRAGESLGSIAWDAGCGPSTVRRHLTAFGTPMRKHCGEGRKFPHFDYALAAKVLAEAGTMAAAARACGVTPPAIRAARMRGDIKA